VDAKLLSSQKFAVSGIRLFTFLACGLTAAAVLLDHLSGQSSLQIKSLTLPLLFSTGLTMAAGAWAVPMLRNLKAGQVIREDGPKSHLKKAGTPTMGGAFFVPVAVILSLLLTGFAPKVIAVCALTSFYGFIGFIDDWQIIRKKSNKGLSPRMKLLMQVTGAIGFCLWMLFQAQGTVIKPYGVEQVLDLTTILLPMGFAIPLGFLYWALAGFVLVAESNATNLTDGVDGLAGGTVAIAFLGLGEISGRAGSPELMIFCAAMSGACLGFLAYNRNPAKVFMGDTGSLALGGALAAVGLVTNSLFALLLLSGLFFWETLSVILQVAYYKRTKDENGVGKRLFKMSPFHNHLELSGWTETKIVSWFYGITAILAVFAIAVKVG
jgi:phospho-N-acetylmuramoyl-pentapeptide-transferase